MNRRPFTQLPLVPPRRKIDPLRIPVLPFFIAGMIVAGIGFYVLSTML